MRESTLREVLLVKAIEDADPTGERLPFAEREAATREALRESSGLTAGNATGNAAGSVAGGRSARKPQRSEAQLESFLQARAARLFPSLAAREPLLRAVASRADLPWWLTLLVLALAFASGFALSALDGRKQIDILALPFLGVLLWNFVSYLGFAGLWLRGRRAPALGQHGGGYWLEHVVAPWLARLLVRVPSGTQAQVDALAGFARDFGQAAAELLVQHAKRLLHRSAAALALGLIAGLYLRGTVLQYQAGWESTFLEAPQVRWLIDTLFGPVASLLHIELPRSDAEVAALRWNPLRGDRLGVDAAPWIHLLAASLVLYVVLPRLLLAALASLRSLRLTRAAALPPSLATHATQLIGAAAASGFALPGQCIQLSLISHTNVGKTTLARTLLHREVGEVRDEEHVTRQAVAYELLLTPEGDLLQLWDTPGFGDSTRLATRLERSGDAIGWFLSQVWDRWTDQAFFLSQQAVANVRESADLVLYLVDASEQPGRLDYLDAEMRILGWIGKPVLVLLNQLGPPRSAPEEAAELERWTRHLAGHACVRDTIAFDAFARCWVQEDLLIERLGASLPAGRQAPWSRIAAAWRARNERVFASSIDVLATTLATVARDGEAVGSRGIAATARDWIGNLGKGEDRRGPFDEAMAALAQRAAVQVRAETSELIRLHGLTGTAAEEIDARLAANFEVKAVADTGKAGLLGAALSGAIGGLAADLATGGLTLGAGALIGGVLGAVGASGLARAYNLARGSDSSQVRWSGALLERLYRLSLLRYLAVAHFGRGRGDFVAAESPAHWDEEVSAVIDTQRPGLAEVWAAAERGESVEDLRGRLRPCVDGALRVVLGRLYPTGPVAGAPGA